MVPKTRPVPGCRAAAIARALRVSSIVPENITRGVVPETDGVSARDCRMAASLSAIRLAIGERASLTNASIRPSGSDGQCRGFAIPRAFGCTAGQGPADAVHRFGTLQDGVKRGFQRRRFSQSRCKCGP